MRYLQLQIHFPPEARHPMHQFLVEQNSIQRAHLRHWNFSNPEYVTTLLHVIGKVEEGREEYVAALDTVETIQEYDVTPVDDRSFYVFIRETAQDFASRLRALLTDTELLIVPPVEYGSDGEMLFEVAGDQDALQGLVANLPDQLAVSINRLGEYDAYRESHVTALTDRQQEVLEVARERGYYEIPRQASVREIADEIGCSKSTAADHLRKAEARLVALYDDRSATG
ncbi:HTH DNA binding domain-containing protein [Halorubrum aquaticum]|uniref:HTH DNA binding domain-containing protein n=1 Tax=Halorubrum aquaticum TaxID=387340 RepID=A0A1I2ZSY2_9EURY|nr:helix-turn-helix domain-containing protein [Halorubrum aquaticum]SFH40181.1 HTH DNA binding domain-containing protein [Halorubrum aquaticum]